MKNTIEKDSIIIDLGAQPFIVSCALKLMGYEVIAYDYNPGPYLSLAEMFGVKVHKCDLERESLGIADESVNCAVLSEVIEHLHPYYINHTLSEVNRVLKVRGKLVITTPSIASLFRRIKLLLGMQPQYRTHVHEYTKGEVERLLIDHGFKIVKSFYTEVNDLSFINAAPEDYLNLKNYWKMLKVAIKKPTRLNVLRATAYPIVKLIPSLRMHIAVVAEKERITQLKGVERW